MVCLMNLVISSNKIMTTTLERAMGTAFVVLSTPAATDNNTVAPKKFYW